MWNTIFTVFSNKQFLYINIKDNVTLTAHHLHPSTGEHYKTLFS